MRPARLAYVLNARLPTEQAHGLQAVKMCEAFAAHGIEVTLYSPRRRQPDPSLAGRSVAEYYGVRRPFRHRILQNLDVVRLEPALPRAAFPALFVAHALVWSWMATRRAERDGADLFFAREPTVGWCLTRRGLPTVFEAHRIPGRTQRRLLRGIARTGSLRLAVAVTSHIASDLVALGFPARRVRTLPDAFDEHAFDDLAERSTCRARLGLPQEPWIVGYVGRFRAQGAEKGIVDLIRAFAHLRAMVGEPVRLLCVGGPPDAVPAYLSLVRELGIPPGDVAFRDHVPHTEVPVWIRACDVVTIPTPSTEFFARFTSPLKLFEYLAAGTPVVASDQPALHDVLTHGEHALLVPPERPDLLGRALHEVLRNPTDAARRAAAAQRHVRPFTWVRRAARILEPGDDA